MATPVHDPKGYYAILDIGRTADGEAVKAAYRARAKVFHPDHNRAPDAVEKFQRLNEAYQVLSDLRRRAAYDAECENWALPAGGSSARPPPPRHRQTQPPPPSSPPPRPSAGRRQDPTDFFACGRCGRVSAQPRYVVFERVRGRVLKTVRDPVAGVFCPACAERTAVEASLYTWLRGWWALPFGPVHTLVALTRNLLGGRQPRDTNARVLLHQARAFLSRGDLDIARAIAEQARSFAGTSETGRDLAILLASLSTRPPRKLKGRWARSGRAVALQLLPMVVVALVVVGVLAATGHGPRFGAEAQREAERTETATAPPHPPPPPAPPPPAVRRGAYHVTARKVAVHDGPGADRRAVASLERFTTVEVLDHQSDEDWLRIIAPGGIIGFVGAELVAEGAGAAAERQWCTDNRGGPVANGTVLVKPSGGPNRLLIRNTTDDDVVVKLKGADGRTQLALYVVARETGQAGGVADGTYQVVLATGGGFSRACGIFLDDMRTVVYPDARTFQARVENNHTVGATVALTLRPPGTAYKPAEPIPPSRFIE
ncbi:MAG: DnaJ domain-containing protein [Alphaproteobacteria bacterium]